MNAFKEFQAALRLVLIACIVSLINAAPGMASPVEARDFALKIPIDDGAGHPFIMQGHMCLPEGVSKPRLVVIAHGSPPSAADRPTMLLAGCHSEAVQWFLHRRRAVALLLRLGYGATGGPWTEGYDGCDKADFYKAGMETARQLDVMVEALARLPQLNPDGVIVLGQSAGGWGTLAYDSIAHPHVAAFIDMAGGRGGHYHDKPDSNCHPERLIDAASRYGRTATSPVLWIASKNDSYFSPDLASSMAAAFNQAGGRAQFEAVGAFGDDGHHLFFGRDGSLKWGPIVERFLGSIPDMP